MKAKEEVKNARPLMLFGLFMVIMEAILIVTWLIVGIIVDIEHVADPTEEVLLEHRLFAWHFVGTLALVLMIETYGVFELVRQKEWSFVSDMGYLASWAIMFVTTLATDTHGVIALAVMTVTEGNEISVRLELVMACIGLAFTVINICWSIAVCVKIYAFDSGYTHLKSTA